MTVDEMLTAMDLGLQKINSFAYDDFQKEEYEHFLNKAQDRFVKQIVNRSPEKEYKGFEESIKRMDDLRTLVVTDWIDRSEASGSNTNAYYDIPYDYMFMLNLRLEAHVNQCGVATTESPLETLPVRIVSSEEIHRLKKHPFGKPRWNAPAATINSDDITIYGLKELYPVAIHLDYIKKPQEISSEFGLDCELPVHTHQDIVDMAVQIILESIESPRYQTNLISNQQQE